MRAILAAKDRFTVHLRPQDVAWALDKDGGPAVDLDAVTAALDYLASSSTGNLLAFPDTGRVATLDDFARKRMIYQLSAAGEAAERALSLYDQDWGGRGQLQAVALEDVAIRLAELRELMDGPDGDEARIHLALRDLTSRFGDLAENATAFMSSVQRSIDLRDADLEAFIAYKERLIGYIERFVEDLVVRGQEIAGLIATFGESDVDRMCAVAAAREGQDRAPGPQEDKAAALEAATLIWRERWVGFGQWFASEPGRTAEADLLRDRARSAVPALLRAVAAVHERRSGRTNRSTDFLTLAGWFAALPQGSEQHRLWRAAFGLTASRHLSVTDQSVEEWRAADVRPSTPWTEAPPMVISPRLRAIGQYEKPGRASRVQDRSKQRRHLALRARAEAAELDAARARLVALGPARLSDLRHFDQREFRLFLALLGDAIAALGSERTQAEVASSDGAVLVRIARVDDGAIARIVTVDGVLTGPDHAIEIVAAHQGGPVPSQRPPGGVDLAVALGASLAAATSGDGQGKAEEEPGRASTVLDAVGHASAGHASAGHA
jgi:uncharacterized protein (TIGR02677 family)